jgi:hypothetical protein
MEDYLTPGEHGFIILTTRIPIGSDSYRLTNLEMVEAVNLLLSIVYDSCTWMPSAQKPASIIANHLNCFPLALVTAGRTILSGVCTLDSFITLYEAQLVHHKHVTADFESEYRALCAVYESLVAMGKNKSIDAIEVLRIISLYEAVGMETLLSGDKLKSIEWSAIRPESRQERQLRNLLQSQEPPERCQITLAAVLSKTTHLIHINEQSVRAALLELRRLLFITFDDTPEVYSIVPLVRSCLYERDGLWNGPPFWWYNTGGNALRLKRCNAFSPQFQ